MEQPPDDNVLSHVESYLNACGVSFASLVIDTLRDPGSTLAKDLISRITDVLDALRPKLDGDAITEFGRFFASIASAELSKLGEDDLWNLPATNLSAKQLQKFSVKEMSRRIASLAPGFSSFLHSVCSGKRVLSNVVVVDEESQNVDPVRLLEIVRPFPYNIYLTHVKSRRRRQSPTSSSIHATGNAMLFKSLLVYTSTQRTPRTKSSVLSTTLDSVFRRRASHALSGRCLQKHWYLFPPLEEAYLLHTHMTISTSS